MMNKLSSALVGIIAATIIIWSIGVFAFSWPSTPVALLALIMAGLSLYNEKQKK
jgi:hypothetical protein